MQRLRLPFEAKPEVIARLALPEVDAESLALTNMSRDAFSGALSRAKIVLITLFVPFRGLLTSTYLYIQVISRQRHRAVN